MQSDIGLPELVSIRIRAYRPDGGVDSYTYDEEEFNDGSANFHEEIANVLADHTWFTMEVHRA